MSAPDAPRPLPRAERLATSRSAYLRAARAQAIDWHPWGPEPFDLARRTGRPILLDIGAAWCHWCHVMDETTYADPEVARRLADGFVAVKVDRDERPEVDRRYQREVHALTGQGGWPLTAFLDADGAAFLGGTFFPPDDGHGRPGFRRVLAEVARLYRETPGDLAENVRLVREAFEREARAPGSGATPAAFVAGVRGRLHDLYDERFGGFGQAPKFPHPTALAFWLWDSATTGDSLGADRSRYTLARMADGGLYDQIGGGFHRYAVDEGWQIPHFEKMAVDNAELLRAYADGARRFGDARCEAVVRGIVGWAEEVLADPGGGFGASQDADNAPGDDGGYFTWSRAELRAALGDEDARFVERAFGVGGDGRMPHDPSRNVLARPVPLAVAAEGTRAPADAEARLGRLVARLKAERDRRPAPAVDRALYAGLNGRFVAGLVAAAGLLGNAALLGTARRTADRFLAAAYESGRGVAHRLDPDGPHGFGLLEDQAHFAAGLVELAGATREARYLDAARALLATVDREYRGDGGLLRDVAPRLYDGPALGSVARPSYPLEDSPHLAANAATALAWERLASLTGDDGPRRLAGQLVAAMAPRLDGAGLFAAGAALAAGRLATPPARIVVVGEGPGARALQRAAERAYHPDLWVFAGVPPPPFALPEELAGAAGGDGAPRALVCLGTRCRPPVTDPAAIRGLLDARPVPPP